MAARRDFGLPNGATKKHDDPQEIPWTPAQPMRRCLGSFRKRRILLAAATLWLLYFFFTNLPTDAPAIHRLDSRYGSLISSGHSQRAPAANPAREGYDGPVRFFDLGPSLRTFVKEPLDQSNVLFVVASVHSASHVVTAACSMAAQNRSRIHVAVMGKEEIPLENILKINTIQLEDCPVRWHKAQVDFPAQSSALRLARGVRGSFGHLQRALGLHAVFFDDSKREDDYLRSAIVKAADDHNVAAVKLPYAESWMLGLSGPSLRWWNQIQIDIVVKVRPESAGSLMRLMRSIRAADYGGLPLPRILLDLPARTDSHILENLERFSWPARSPPADSRLSIRRRVDDKPPSRAAASAQVIESFYPTDPYSSHVLVLTPAVEVAPNYYQVLMYLILEYRYSRPAHGLADNLMGVSLLNGPTDKATLAASQSLNDEAMLFFGDKWAELHEYLSLRLVADPKLSKSVDGDGLDKTNEANWVTLATEMMRAQGYITLAPQFNHQESLAVVHRELDKPAEEESNPPLAAASMPELGTENGVLTADSGKSGWREESRELSRASLSTLLGYEQRGLDTLPLFSYQGKPVNRSTLRQEASRFAEMLAVEIGGCPPSQAERQPGDLGLLFC